MAGTALAEAFVALRVTDQHVKGDVDKAMSGAGADAEKHGSAAGKRYALAAGAAVAAGAVAFGAASVDAYTEAQTSQGKLADAFERFPKLADTNQGSLQSLNSELQKKTRFDDDALAVGQAQLAQYGLTGKQVTDLTPLLADYAAKTGKDAPEAAKDLGKALLGQGRALKDVGIDFKDTGDVGGNFDEIMGGLRTQVGGFAEKEGATAAGQSEILKNQFGELEETVGSLLLPVLQNLATAGIAVIAFIQDNISVIGPLAAGVAGLGLAYAGTAAWIALSTTGTVAHTVVMGIARAATAAWTGAQWLINAALSANPIGIVVVAIGALVAGVIYAYTHFETFRAIVDAAWDGIQTAAKFAWENVLQPIFGYLVQTVQDAWANFNTFKDTVSTVWDNIKSATQTGVRSVVGFFLDMAGRILDSAAQAFGWVPGIGDKLREAQGKFQEFRDSVNASLSGIRDENVKLTADMVAHELIAGQSAITTGVFHSMATGGGVSGPGTGTSDTAGLFRLSNGEHVFTNADVKAMGGQGAVSEFRKSLHGMAGGGPVQFDVDDQVGGAADWLAGRANAFVDRSENALSAAATAYMKANLDKFTGGIGSAQYLGGGRVSILGKLLDATTAGIFQHASGILGGLQLMQGSWSSSVAASGGTHSGSGAMDVAPNTATWDRAVSVIRSLGAIAWHRTPAQGPWGHHIHSITPGIPGLSAAAAAQVADFRRGGDGLGGMFAGGPVSVFDKGGWLMPGEMGVNLTRTPERVLPPGAGGVTVVVNVNGSVTSERDLARTVRDNLVRLGRRGDPLPA